MNQGMGEGSSGKSEFPVSGAFLCPFCKKQHPRFINRCPEDGKPIDRAFKMEGQVLEGKYRVGQRVGRGGMGVVHEGEHLSVGRKVAIKFLLEDASKNPMLLQRFENEARLAASIGNRNIVDILDLGETHDGVHYIVMEYLDGRDLADIMRGSTCLTVTMAVEFTVQILSALRSMHDAGIIHRDLKPENVIITKGDERGFTVKLVDFGLSRLGVRESDLGITQTGAVFGTPRYMAPEQARAKEVDHRADLYSVGVMLYRMLSGKLPFNADNYNELIIQLTTEQPVHVGEHGVPIPEGLGDIVMLSITRDPLHRYESATAFFEALRPYRSWTNEGAASSSAPPPHPLSLGTSGIRKGLERPRSEHDSSSESSHSYSYSCVGSGADSNMVDRVGPRRSVAKLRLATDLDDASSPDPSDAKPLHPSVRDDADRSLSYSVMRSHRSDTDPNMVDRVSVSGKKAVQPTDAEAALRGAMQKAAHRKAAAQPPAPGRRRSDSTSPWTFADIQVEDNAPPVLDDPDDSVSTVGWESRPSTSARRSIPIWAVAASVAVVVLLGVGATTLLLKLRAGEKSAPAPAAAPVVVQDEPDKGRVTWEVELRSLPEAAEVYVDGALHPERPVVLENLGRTRILRVTAEGYAPWEKEVAVYSDISLNVSLRLAKVEVAEKVVEDKVVKKGSKKSGKVEKKKGSKIDTVYPGLQ
ncbi:MAG: serine/threonine protein kinase [Deltaproteobacteria bacterium]|nr:serine/threonine protein kinase [Deltaproteobacteria bacterium]